MTLGLQLPRWLSCLLLFSSEVLPHLVTPGAQLSAEVQGYHKYVHEWSANAVHQGVACMFRATVSFRRQVPL